jgi:uncharacterized ion transporter superfamily protein YfcC
MAAGLAGAGPAAADWCTRPLCPASLASLPHAMHAPQARATPAVALIRRGRAQLHLLLLFVLFSLGGAVFGMGVEAVALCLLLAPLLVRLGCDSLCAVIVSYVATQIGFAKSWMNPFSVAVAQGISGVPVGSGAGLRMGTWAEFTAFGIGYLMHCAARVKADPARSLTRAADLRHFPAPPPHSADAGAQIDGTGQARSTLALADMAVLAIAAAGMVWVSWGVLAWLARLPGCDAHSLAATFRRGMADMLPAVLVVALAKGLGLLLGGDNPGRPSVLNTLLFHMGQGQCRKGQQSFDGRSAAAKPR